MRILIIALSVCIVVFLGLFSVRMYGLSVPPKEFHHPILDGLDSFETVYSPESPTLESIARQPEMGWTALPVYLTQDGKFFVFPNERTSSHCEENQEIERSTLASLLSIRCAAGTFAALPTYLKRFPERKFWISLKSNVYSIHKFFTDAMSSATHSNFIIHSDYPVVLSSIRKLNPNWIYASGRPDETRLIALHALFLETVWTPATDIVALRYRQRNRVQIDTRLIDEIHRQKKIVFLLGSENDLEAINQLRADGIILQD